MKVLLHIGQSKTGTSAIQAFLTLNRGKLHKNDVLYPPIKIKGMPLNLGAHNAVADALADHIRFPNISADEYFRQFFDDAAKIQSPRLILSAEHFFAGEPRVWSVRDEAQYFELYRKKIERLAGYLKGHDVSILIYLRPQIDWFASAVSQTVRIKRLISERHIYQSDRQFFELMKPLLKYADLLDAWQEIIKPTSFSVIPYIRSALHEKSSVADFLKRAGLNHIKYDYANSDIQVNESLNREFIEVKKILNRTPRSENEERTIIRCLENLSRDNPSSSQYALDPDVRSDIEAFVLDQNERITSNYLTDGTSFQASSSNRAPLAKPGEDEVNKAMQIFDAEFNRPKYKLLLWSFVIRAFLRAHAKPLHAILHQLKVLYWAIKYKN